ncbi:MAG: hypothetical protein HLUCCA01_06485 [Bacteroidetes bacterium HLUCCA01]|nr:MAG: hypothetical protein HLUCCA01_06485 [Bacteroidetes bacterium HLUCCA01]
MCSIYVMFMLNLCFAHILCIFMHKIKWMCADEYLLPVARSAQAVGPPSTTNPITSWLSPNRR